MEILNQFSNIIAFINPRSGGKLGAKLYTKLRIILGSDHVFDLTEGGPEPGLTIYRKKKDLIIIACGGDGTVGWVHSVIDKIKFRREPKVVPFPLGTGNDMSRVLQWGANYAGESVLPLIQEISIGLPIKMDRWSIRSELLSEQEMLALKQELETIIVEGSTVQPSTSKSTLATSAEIKKTQFKLDVDDSIDVETSIIDNGDGPSTSMNAPPRYSKSTDIRKRRQRSPSSGPVEHLPQNSDQPIISPTPPPFKGKKKRTLPSSSSPLSATTCSTQTPAPDSSADVSIKISYSDNTSSNIPTNPSSPSSTSSDQYHTPEASPIDNHNDAIHPVSCVTTYSSIEPEVSKPSSDKTKSPKNRKRSDTSDASGEVSKSPTPGKRSKSYDLGTKKRTIKVSNAEIEATSTTSTATTETETITEPTDDSSTTESSKNRRKRSKSLPVNDKEILNSKSKPNKKDVEIVEPCGGEVSEICDEAISNTKTKKRTSSGEAKSLVMNNYFSFGVDSMVALDFHNKRESSPQLFPHHVINKAWYGIYGIKHAVKNISSKKAELHRSVKLELDGVNVDIPRTLEAIVFLQIPSYSSGTDVWGDTHRTKGQKSPPSVSDGIFEVVGLKGVMHLGRLQAGWSSGIRLGQASRAVITNLCELPAQCDGEPWLLPPCKTVVEFKNQSTMLFNFVRGKAKKYKAVTGLNPPDHLVNTGNNVPEVDVLPSKDLASDFTDPMEERNVQHPITLDNNTPDEEILPPPRVKVQKAIKRQMGQSSPDILITTGLLVDEPSKPIDNDQPLDNRKSTSKRSKGVRMIEQSPPAQMEEKM